MITLWAFLYITPNFKMLKFQTWPLYQPHWSSWEPVYKLSYSFSLTKNIFLFSTQLQLEGLRYSSVPVVNGSMPILDVVITRSFHLLERPLRYIKTSPRWSDIHNNDVIMGAVASQITSLGIVFSTVYSGADQRNTKALRHWPLWGEFTGDRWIPRTNGQ